MNQPLKLYHPPLLDIINDQMKIIFTTALILFVLFNLSISKASAIYDPTSVPNNKIGIHILFSSELEKSKELVNSSGGDWGYITIPIQAGDKDIKKWQHFMDEARNLHLIPIVRLATEGDYFQKESWRKPNEADVVDFANFLDSLNWPTKNRYIMAFNEVNRADEWNGEANPAEYAQILAFTSDVFKSKNPDYFIISSGMDNASITSNGTYNQFDYFRLMNDAIPGVFDKIDGLSSHSYPNPAFSQPPDSLTRMSISSFIFEKEFIESMSNKKFPIFITETGWDQIAVSEKQTAEYFKIALDTIWNNESIVAITPFLLKSGPGPFEKFSFLKNDDSKNEVFKTVERYKKTQGRPILNGINNTKPIETTNDLPVKDFSEHNHKDDGREIKLFVKWLLIPL